METETVGKGRLLWHSFGKGSDRDGRIMKKEPIGGDGNAQGSGTVPRGE